MSLRGILRQEAEQKYLAAGERAQEAMLAVALRPLLLYPLGWLLLDRDAYRAVICTDRRILLCKVDHATGCLEGLVQSEHRRCRLGPPRTPLMTESGCSPIRSISAGASTRTCVELMPTPRS